MLPQQTHRLQAQLCVWGGVRPWQSCISLLQPKDPAMSSALGLSRRRSGGVEEMGLTEDPLCT